VCVAIVNQHAMWVLVGKPEEKSPLGRTRRRWEDNIKIIFRKWDVGAWTGVIWLRTETGGGHLWSFGFHKMRGISWLAENPLVSQEGLYSMESKCMSNALSRFSAVRLSQCHSPSTPPLSIWCNVKVNSGHFEGCTTGPTYIQTYYDVTFVTWLLKPPKTKVKLKL